MHIFPYSIRNNTPAATMKQVNDSIKKERVHEVLELSNALENEYYNNFLTSAESGTLLRSFGFGRNFSVCFTS